MHIPEVVEPDEKLPRDLLALRRLARLLDTAFELPGTRARFGLDALLGLIPGAGDIVAAALSTWIIAGALRHRVPPVVVLRMIGNVVADLLFGAIPVAGDLFDLLYQQNARNMRLLERHRDRRRPPRSTARIAGVVAAVFLLFVLIAVTVLVALAGAVLWLVESLR